MQKCICCLSSNTEFLFNTIDLPAGNLNLSSSKKSSLETSLISLNLYKCRNCSHIFNINSKINSKDYDKDVNFTWFESKSWIENSYKLADLVSNKFTSKISYILEIGSGSGNFIRYLSSLTNLNIYAYDKTLNTNNNDRQNLNIIKSLFSFDKKELPKGKPLIIMRHVLEHFKNPYAVINNLVNTFEEGFKIFIEVPNIMPTLENFRFNDFVHEHISYFSLRSLIKLITIFDGEILECINTYNDENIIAIANFNGNKKKEINYSEYYSIFKNNLKDFVTKTYLNKKNIIIWGAGGRGVSIILLIREFLNSEQKIQIIDSDKTKINLYVPGTDFCIKDKSILKEEKKGSEILITTLLGLQDIKKEINKSFKDKFSINAILSNKVVEV